MLTNEKAGGVLETPTPAESKTEKLKFSPKSTASEAQIERMLDLLRRGPRNTHELRRHGISHPAGRAHDLSRQGFRIATDRVTTVDSDSFLHTGVALYTLVSEPGVTNAPTKTGKGPNARQGHIASKDGVA